ncbi:MULTISPECIES: restriction endonuclease subunit S [unclassified Streptomyces]|uniref:restriction endonuclease subunit S n=1 Tax=unclassified Streptomyces TaxID=2593676 RepID=UPI0036FB00D1
MNSYRVKNIARINRQTLPEDTDPGFRFRYVDISAVDSLGNVTIPDNEIVFSGAPSRARRLAPPGSVVVSTVRTYLRAIGTVPVTADPLVFSTGFAVLEAGPEVDSRFLAYHCQSQPFIDDVVARSTGVSYPAINPGEIGNLRIVLPSREEQRRIADFLDAEIARIDRLAAKRDHQIAALSERELAVIGHTLSGGATPVDGRSTGWPWLPHIPTTWGIGPIYAYYFTELGKMLNSDRAAGDNQRPYLRNANVHWHEIDTTDMATMHFDPSEAKRYSVRQGDLLVCEGGAGVAEAAVWDGRIEECYFQKSLHRVRQAGPVPVEWLMYWLRFAKSCGVFNADGNIATIPHLTGEQLRQYRIPIPDDGPRLIARTSSALRHISTVRKQLNKAQRLLGERRQALITAAVTGKFDVSTASGRNVTEGVTV